MMNIFRNILMGLVLFSISFAQAPEDLMSKANSFYQSEEWDEAISTYEKVLNQDYESAALYYNLGNSYFKSGVIGKAILNYERALKLDPGDDDIQFNLKLAQTRTVDRIQEVPQLFILEWWDLLITSVAVSTWALIAIILYLILLISIGLYLLSQSISLQKLSVYSGVVSFAVLFLSLIILFSAYSREVTTDHGVVTSDLVNVKVSPTGESSDAFVIHEGLKFEIQDQLDDWVKIKLADGKVGWIPDNSLEKI